MIQGLLDREALEADLIRDEGVRLALYFDTKGIPTIGIGHNLTRGLTRPQVDLIFRDDLDEVLSQCARTFPWWPALDGVRKRVLANWSFNLGTGHLASEFAPTLRLIADGDYREAARHMRASLWARQVGQRAERLARMMESGEAA